jgi:ABC-type nitrate/sulfonate/bicarbonate transport system permease component
MNNSSAMGRNLALPPNGVLGRLQKLFSSSWGARLSAYIVFLIMWQLVAMIVPRAPGPVPVFTFIWIEMSGGSHGGVLRGQFLDPFIVTLQRFSLGLAMAIVSGTLLGIVIGSLPFFRALLNDTLLVFLALPAIIWAFLTTMWFGIGPRAPIVTTFLTAAPFVAVNVAQGVRAITPDLHRMSAAFGVPVSKRVRYLILPAVMGYLFAGIRFAIIIGWNGVLLSEWFGAAEGVGWRTRFWYDANRYRGFVGWVVIFIIFIVLLDRLALTPIQRYAFRWRDAQAQSSGTTESSMASS